jgi:leader peptidase (prepilin peptidase) / N-methyltransferase
LLKGQCRTCKKPISWLYPFIELLTAALFSGLYLYIPLTYFFAYFIFFSALIVTIRSDIETMLISRFATVFLVPFGIIFSATDLLPISPLESIAGATFGYLFLATINYIFKYLRNKTGIGQGDFDLLFFIGSFTGILGCWTSITIGSTAGCFYALCAFIFHTYNKTTSEFTSSTKIPFGPFLAFGALFFVFFQQYIFFLFYF